MRKPPRPINQVIDAIIISIHPNWPGRSELENALDKIKTSSLYAAPEAQLLFWKELFILLESRLGVPGEMDEWKQTISDIMGDRRDYRLVLECQNPDHEYNPKPGCPPCDYWVKQHQQHGRS